MHSKGPVGVEVPFEVPLRAADWRGNSSRYHYLGIDKFTAQLALVRFPDSLAMLDWVIKLRLSYGCP